jgi:hypothetical protein
LWVRETQLGKRESLYSTTIFLPLSNIELTKEMYKNATQHGM